MESHIVNNADMENFELVQWGSFELGFYSQKKAEKSGPNEDSLGIIADNTKAVLVVADGVGGSPKGEDASLTAVDKIIKSVAKFFSNTRKESKIRIHILDGIEAAHENIVNKNTGERTTVTTCAIDNNFVRCYQIGDSSALVCGQKGLLKYKALEQSPVGYAVRAGFLDEKMALDHPQRNIVSNLMGEPDMSIEIGPQIPFAQNDTVLIASDGVFDNFSTDELIDIIRKESVKDVMTKLTELCQPLRSGVKNTTLRKSDDISFIVCRHR